MKLAPGAPRKQNAHGTAPVAVKSGAAAKTLAPVEGGGQAAPSGSSGLASRARHVGSAPQLVSGVLGVRSGEVAVALPPEIAREIEAHWVPGLDHAARLTDLAFQIAGIDEYHLNDLQYDPPLEQITRTLTHTLERMNTLQKEVGPQPRLREIEDAALTSFAALIARELEPRLAKLEARAALSQWDREGLQGDSHGVKKLSRFLSAIGERDPEHLSPAYVSTRQAWMGLMSRLAKIARKPAPEPRPVILEFPPQEPDRWLKMDEKTLAVWSELLPAGLALHEERHDRVSLAGSVASKIVFNGIKALTDLLESKVQAVAAAKEKGDLTSLARLEALRDGVSALLLDTAARTARSWMTQVSEGPRGDSVRSAYALLAEKIRLVEPHAAGSPDLQARLTECSKLRDGARAALTAGGRGAVAAALEAVQSGGKIGVLESELTALHQFIGRHFPGSAEHAALAQDAAGACAKIRLTFLERDLSNALAGLPRLQAAKPGEIPSAELRDLHHAAGAVEEAASCRGRHAKTGLLAATPPPEETAILDQLATLGPKLQAELDRLGFDPFAL